MFSYARGFAPCIPGAVPTVRRKTDRKRFPMSSATRVLPPTGHLLGRFCKCRKRSNAGVPGAVAPGEIK